MNSHVDNTSKNSIKEHGAYINCRAKEFDRVIDCWYRYISPPRFTLDARVHTPISWRIPRLRVIIFSSFPRESETWEQTQLRYVVSLLSRDNGIKQMKLVLVWPRTLLSRLLGLFGDLASSSPHTARHCPLKCSQPSLSPSWERWEALLAATRARDISLDFTWCVRFSGTNLWLCWRFYQRWIWTPSSLGLKRCAIM